MEEKFEDKKEQEISSEADRYRASAESHKEALKSLWSTFATTGVIMILIIVFIAFGGFGWFVSNTQVHGASGGVFAKGQTDFELATVGSKSQGVYDSLLGLSGIITSETIGDTTYYVSSGNSSFYVSSSKNLNNYLENADLRPGNRGSFDIYLIRRNTKANNLRLEPVLTPYLEDKNPIVPPLEGETPTEVQTVAEFLKGHFLLFTNMDDKGMYSGNIDFSQPLEMNFSKASKISVKQGERTWTWGERVHADTDTEVYRFPVYWVWPDQFGNFIYTGNAYNKNLFANDRVADYSFFVNMMQDSNGYKNFFSVAEGVDRPKFSDILQPTDYHKATQYYDLYTGWYNLADERIGEKIRYIELGFEISNETFQSGEIE